MEACKLRGERKGGRNVRWLSVVIVTASNESNERAIYRCAQLPWEERTHQRSAVPPPKPFHIDQPHHHLSQGQPTHPPNQGYISLAEKGLVLPPNRWVPLLYYGIVFKHAIVCLVMTRWWPGGTELRVRWTFYDLFPRQREREPSWTYSSGSCTAGPGVSPQTDTNTYGKRWEEPI